MFDNWTTKKTIWTLVIIALLVAAYNWKWISMKLGYDPATRKFCGGGMIWPNAYRPWFGGVTPIVAYEQGGIVNPGCGGGPATTNTGIPIEVVPTRY